MENRKRCHRVHGFFASTRHDVRHGAVGGGCPSEAFGQARHGEVFVRRLRQRCAVVGFAAASRDNRDRRCVGGDFQRALGLGDVVVAGFGVAIQCVAEGIRALTDRHLDACEAVGRAFAGSPAAFHRQAVGICVFHLSVCQCCAVELAGLAAAGQGHCLRSDRQRAGRTLVDLGEVFRHICCASEYLELRHRVHGLLAVSGNHIRHNAIRHGCPREAVGHPRHGEIVVCCLCQRRTVVSFAAAGRHNRNICCVGGDNQRAVSGSDVCILILMLDGEIVAVVVRAIVAESRDPAARRSDRQGIADRQLELQAVAARHRVDACAAVSHRVFRLRVRVAVIHPAVAGGGNHNRRCVGGDFQRIFGLDDVVVGSCRVLFQGIAEGVHALADGCLAAREGVIVCTFAVNPAGLHR